MSVVKGELFFAPDWRMRDLNLDDPQAVLSAFIDRVEGLFLSPIRSLIQNAESEQGALFAGALLVAALIESLARLDTGSSAQGTLIGAWLESHIAAFQEEVTLNGEQFTLANVFEYRFPNGLAHNGYVASLGRLSRDIDGPVNSSDGIVTVNPFELAKVVADRFHKFASDLRSGDRDIKQFAYKVKERFQHEVERARLEAGV